MIEFVGAAALAYQKIQTGFDVDEQAENSAAGNQLQ